MVTSLQILEIMQQEQTSLSKLSSTVEKFPQTLLNIAVAKKPPLETLSNVKEIIHKVESSLGKEGRVLVRYSGTENLCRVMVEGPKKSSTDSFAQAIGEAIKNEIGV
jgi:phosphoglucosamine mutase